MKIFESIPTEEPSSELLKNINSPKDLRKLSPSQIPQLADELREYLLYTVGKTGGHFGAGLGVIELTLALHYAFETPHDRLVWDVGHQTYPHKIITGRRDRIKTLRKGGGLSGFTKRTESEYDPFGAAHSSTSISSTLGMAVAKRLSNNNNNVVAVIGDGAMSAGMAYEAMNNAGYIDTNMIIILNDNQQVSLPTQYNSLNQDPVGALSSTFARLQSSKPLRELRESAKAITKQMPTPVQEVTAKVDEYARGMISGSGATLFEELGLYYIGTVDGHNLNDLVAILQEVDHIFISSLKRENLYDKVWQAGAIFLPVQSVGVMGDERTYENVVSLRAVESTDGMTADWVHLPYDFLSKVSNDIINKVHGVNRVVYDISSKPPATIEWE